MKNLKPSSKVAFDVYSAILGSKKDRELIGRLSVLDVIVKNACQLYEKHFAENSLEKLIPSNINPNLKPDLLKLYSFKNKIIREIKNDITVFDSDRIINTCQNCTINSVNSLDHYLPATDFAEFIVNPKNLFPSCSECNSYKAKYWKIGEERFFLNLYLDLLPTTRYLFVEFDKEGNSVTFLLKNDGGIETKLFKIIVNHYNRLHLLMRFRENCSEVISELENTISSLQSTMSFEDIVRAVLGKEEKDMKFFGFNYWKSVLRVEYLKNKRNLKKYS